MITAAQGLAPQAVKCWIRSIHLALGVLPAEAPYLANLAALWEVDQKLAGAIEAEDEFYATEPSKAGPATVAVENQQGKKIFLHSRYDPLAEARKMVGHVKAETNYIFAVHGLGAGVSPANSF